MKCSDVDRILPDIVDGVAMDNSQDLEVQSHLRNCLECSDLVSDLRLIAREARQLAESEEPSPRVWARIAAELRAEGLIREPELDMARPVIVPTRQRRWNPFWLAPVAAAILVAGSYLLFHYPPNHGAAQASKPSVAQPLETQVVQQAPSQQPVPREPALQPSSNRQVASKQQPASAPDSQTSKPLADQEPTDGPAEQAELAPTASDNQFLSEVSQRAPAMRAAYADQLQAVNNEIRETKAYISQYPGDLDARQHLLEVYQQKVMLYQIALDRIQ